MSTAHSVADLEDAVWRKSSRSGTGSNGACVEVALAEVAVGVRDSKNPEERWPSPLRSGPVCSRP